MPFSDKTNTNLKEFRNIVGDAARQYLFEISIPILSSTSNNIQNIEQVNPLKNTLSSIRAGINSSNDTKVITCLARSTILPKMIIEDVPFEFQKSTFHMGGRATFDTWNVTFLADAYHKLRNRLLAWQNLIFDPVNQIGSDPSSYKTNDVTVKQLDRMGIVVVGYNFMGLYPTEVGEIQLSQSDTEVETFNVTFTYDFYKIDGSGGTTTKYNDLQSAINLNVGDSILHQITAPKTASKSDVTDVDVNGRDAYKNTFSSGFFASIGNSIGSSSQPFGKGKINTPDSSNRETLTGDLLSFNPYNALGIPYSYRWMPPVKGFASLKISRRGIG